LRGVTESEGAGAAASDGGRNVHLPRQALRRALLERLAPGTVRWGRRLERYVEHEAAARGTEDGTAEAGTTQQAAAAEDGTAAADPPHSPLPPVELIFEGGGRATADLLVGADGIFSNIRRQKLGNSNNNEAAAAAAAAADDTASEEAATAAADPYPLRYLGVVVVLGICRGNRHPLCHHKVFQVVDGETRWGCTR
jgi:salicylate hydroxylase